MMELHCNSRIYQTNWLKEIVHKIDTMFRQSRHVLSHIT
jgi:hypothetical protein